MSGQFHAHCKSSLGRGLVGAAFGSGTFWSLVRAQLVQFVVAQRRGRAGARQPRQPRRQWRAVASRGQSSAPNFFDGLGPWACQEAAGWEKLAKNSQAGPGGGCVTEAAIGTRSLVTGVKFFFKRVCDGAAPLHTSLFTGRLWHLFGALARHAKR